MESHRDDDRTREEIGVRLATMGLHGVDVAVTHGEVTLRGQVATRDDRQSAANAAGATRGIRTIRNEVRVSPPQ